MWKKITIRWLNYNKDSEMHMQSDNKAVWTQPNDTMSDKSARNEFGLTQEEIILGIRSGKLQYKENNMHGNPYLKLIRSEVEDFVTKKYGKNHVQKKITEKELSDISRQINAAKRKIKTLEKRKCDLLNMLSKE